LEHIPDAPHPGYAFLTSCQSPLALTSLLSPFRKATLKRKISKQKLFSAFELLGLFTYVVVGIEVFTVDPHNTEGIA
jgi:hypothetical protein